MSTYCKITLFFCMKRVSIFVISMKVLRQLSCTTQNLIEIDIQAKSLKLQKELKKRETEFYFKLRALKCRIIYIKIDRKNSKFFVHTKTQ